MTCNAKRFVLSCKSLGSLCTSRFLIHTFSFSLVCRTIFPNSPASITIRCASPASARGIFRPMIEHFVRALFARELETFVTARGSEHAQTASASQLHRRTSDTAARTVHEYRLIRFRVSALEQPAICGRVRRAHGCALGEGDIWRQAMYLRLFTQRTLCIRAAY